MKTHPAPASQLSRRTFLAASAAAATGPLILPKGSALGYQANDRLNLAIIGVAGYCAAAAFIPAMHIYDNVHVTALCDVDQRKALPQLAIWKERARTWPTSNKPEERRAADIYVRLAENVPPLVEDYRRLFDDHADDFDAVVVATPDHSHAAPSALAIRAGKNVLTEKPLTITVAESRALKLLAAEHRVATSLGNQGTQSPQFRRGLQLIREGVLGPVKEVLVWFDRGGRNLREAPSGTRPIPPELNWDLWLGPVAWREYHPEWIARTHWRETSAGELGNFGPHTANLAFMALQLTQLWEAEGATIRIEAECSSVNRLSFPVWEKITWQVPARGALPPVTFAWHQGPKLPPGSREMIEGRMREHGASDADIEKLLLYAGAMIIGERGALVTDSHNVQITLLPREKFADVDVNTVPARDRSTGHYRDWLRACRDPHNDELTPWSSFSNAAPFNEFLMLGDVATRFAGQALEYDPQAGKITNHTEANQALSYEYRTGWRL